ncbi:Holliday junction resolvase RuvX [Candidatus Deianiraea vastatrix]|uniref:Putative pre-16S rRNA nuclease n=1 Tax=Candidatus Deianiraea vastatrix TaxID=2163644 RepID=A0A5B8XE21_9RICK|nr:Holliday junction resolvase RuvX [Candidatus Deianiraea vastatrix]QED23558.1 Putative RuvA/C related protein [Candidatus Deianiraea vastatrix]
MITFDISEFANNIKNGKILGIDYGAKKIGLSITDNDRIIAVPMQIINNDDNFLQNFHEIIKCHDIKGIAIGIPLDILGNLQDFCNVIITFANKLYQEIQIPIFLQDERMTTRLANTLQLSSGKFGKQSVLASKNHTKTRISQNKSWKNHNKSEKYKNIDLDFIKPHEKSAKKGKMSLNTVNFQDDAVAACQILDTVISQLNIANKKYND